MKEFTIEHLSHDVGAKKLFDDVTFSIKEKQKIGLVGVNGTGKSTFLDIIAQVTDPDQGQRIHPHDYYIGYLRQSAVFYSDHTVLDTVFEGDTPMMQAVKEYEKALHLLEENYESEEVQKAFSKAEEKMHKENAWTADAEAKTILTKLGIPDMNLKMGDLSGGQVKRVMLAQVLIQAPDLLILDEPTNHLDYEMISWLEGYIRNYPHAVLLVSHDRYFLNHSVDTIMELRHQKLFTYPGNYEKYVQLKAEEEALLAEHQHKQKQMYKKELDWMREGVRARGTKQKARVERFKELEAETKQVGSSAALSMNFQNQRLGNKVIEFEEANLSIAGKTLLKDFNLLVQNRDRIGITGENGSGKSSLFNVIAGKIPLDSGQIILGETVRIGYYTQHTAQLDPNQRVINYLQETAGHIQLGDGQSVSVSQLLERFLFPKESHGSLIGSLSGGERKRLCLLNILMQKPNVLLLDEPTNDLDIETLTILEDYLESFEGAVLTISHDRYFLDKTARQLLIFHGEGNIESYVGRMSDYLEEEADQAASAQAKAKKVKVQKEQAEPVKKEKTRLNYHEQKEWESIEDELFAMDERLEEIGVEMAASGHDLSKLQNLDKERIELEEALESKMERWEYLSQFVKE